MRKLTIIKALIPVFIFILLILKIVAIPGCANIIPPAGGDRDSLPPLLLEVDPPDSSRNSADKTITFVFDEYLDQPYNLQENLLVSPTPDIMPQVETKLKTLTVRLKDSLEANTTYYLNFGNAIRDINEGNALRDFSYIFSTGPVLDSLELNGKVILAETGKTDSTLIVMLHRSGEDSAVINEKPRYTARLDGSGSFRFRFLPPGTFHIYALKDDGGGRKYDRKTQLFAFSDTPVEIKPDAGPVTLYAFAEKKDQLVNPGIGITRPGGNRPDDRRLKFSPNLIDNQQDLLSDFVITFEQPLRFFDSSKLQLSTDSGFQPVDGYRWLQDSLKKKISLTISWKENTLYNLILDKDFAEDTLGRKLLKTDTLHFRTKKRSEYGSLKIRFRNLQIAKNPVLQFVQGDQVVRSYPLASETFIQPLFLPGEYEMRILYDENRNGVWDPGEFFGKRKQPEIVRPVERRITVKMNWNNEFEIAL